MIVELNTYIHVGLLFIKPKQYFLRPAVGYWPWLFSQLWWVESSAGIGVKWNLNEVIFFNEAINAMENLD